MPRRYKVRDLMIDIQPQAGGGGRGGRFCFPCTGGNTGGCRICSQGYTPDPCGNCTVITITNCGVCTGGYTPICPGYTPICPANTLICPGGTCPGGSVIDEIPRRIPRTEDLAALKDELRQALAEVETQERVMEESMRPQTLEEAEELERKLNEALDDLRTQKEELRRRSREGGQ